MSNAPKSYVYLKTMTGVMIDQERCSTWKDMREAVRRFREQMRDVDFDHNWSVVIEA